VKSRDVFADTSAFIALRVSDDEHHNEAQKYLEVIKTKRLRLHTTNFILDEVYTYFCRLHEIAVEMAELIMDNPLITLHRVAAEDEEQAWQILKQYGDKGFSYTDAASFAAMERLGIMTAFAFDEHFEQYGQFAVVPDRRK
jgi:predicted nucleic acid-binding protein